MSDDLLPEWVNLILDDFETSLCLPILVVIILCTAQLAFNHIFGIGYTIYRNVKGPAAETEALDKEATDVMRKLKEMLIALGIGKADNTDDSSPIKNPALDDQSEEERECCEAITE